MTDVLVFVSTATPILLIGGIGLVMMRHLPAVGGGRRGWGSTRTDRGQSPSVASGGRRRWGFPYWGAGVRRGGSTRRAAWHLGDSVYASSMTRSISTVPSFMPAASATSLDMTS